MLVFLIGFMGSGKTTLGKRLANKLNWRFIDTDNYIEEHSNSTVEDIFKNEGEEKFRKYELEALNSIRQEYQKAIVSTGGGTACFNNNIDLMNESGLTFYLKADIGLLMNRITFSERIRPLVIDLNQKELAVFIENKVAEREIFYNKAKFILEVKNISLENVVQIIKNEFKL